ncbi:cyclin family protein Ecym_4430 [Eremothecium cymbalariae DBVPG|uniref:Uncharacterized protein n=1 Tax=Eremothecium cymbalariae (strain CBS 270.75 / DBVPG 7215 / KCTC 17166 / NRRL Y-17582) TaxID=931890 RepID=G8JTX4_ERECY|nr:hypothetical protein Ecym_4430 [Eremothecium cymbalariae DBVPG\
MSAPARSPSVSDENSSLAKGIAPSGGCGGKDAQTQQKKRSSTLLGVPRKALSTVTVNTKKKQHRPNLQQQQQQYDDDDAVRNRTRSASKKRAIYHDSDGEEETETESEPEKHTSSRKKKKQQCASPKVAKPATSGAVDGAAAAEDGAVSQLRTPQSSVKTVPLIQKPFPHKDLDSLEADDVTMCVDYTNEIFAHLLRREQQTTCLKNYVQDKQFKFYIRPSMRAILVDWLIEVHLKFQLLPEALYLSINIMDRYLSSNKVSLSKLQLVAITSLLIAAKFEEVNLPKLSNYVYITDNAYTMDEIKLSECNILNSLEFNIGWPNPMNFLRRISKADNYNHNTRNFAKLFLEFGMCCSKFIHVVPSVMAAVSMHCAMRLTYGDDKFEWDDTLEWYSSMATKSPNHDFEKLCNDLIIEFQEPTTQLNALSYKYKKLGLWDTVKNWCDEQKIVK